MIVTVASFKGGVGKSTTALHLAAYFAKDALTIVVDHCRRRRKSLYHLLGPWEDYERIGKELDRLNG